MYSTFRLTVFSIFIFATLPSNAQTLKPTIVYTVSMPDAEKHLFHVELVCKGWNRDSIELKLPNWTPGYYLLMDYAKGIKNFSVTKLTGQVLGFSRTANNAWKLPGKNPFKISYDVSTERKFVATSYIDSTHGYIVPGELFMYVNGSLKMPVTVRIQAPAKWNKIATGLDQVKGEKNVFHAADFDVLYDSPILIGDLKSFLLFG